MPAGATQFLILAADGIHNHTRCAKNNDDRPSQNNSCSRNADEQSMYGKGNSATVRRRRRVAARYNDIFVPPFTPWDTSAATGTQVSGPEHLLTESGGLGGGPVNRAAAGSSGERWAKPPEMSSAEEKERCTLDFKPTGARWASSHQSGRLLRHNKIESFTFHQLARPLPTRQTPERKQTGQSSRFMFSPNPALSVNFTMYA